MPDYRNEFSLLLFVLLNISVFGSAWKFASRRMTGCRSQAILDAALIGYAIQYVSVGLAGLLHCLGTAAVAGFAIFISGTLCFVGCNGNASDRPKISTSDRLILAGVALFTTSFILVYANSQSALPVISNDALTYHFPAAAAWLQQGRISLFQTWFFNPANTYSPLAGSMFIAWMMAPLGSDVLARFVEVPALICVGIAMYRLCREMGVRVAVAVFVASAAILARPIFLPSMMGKDDLFVAFFFIAALVALSRDRSLEPWGAARFGIALGLLLATKYTAMLNVPILLLAIDGPRWRVRGWIIAIGMAMLLAGPWYLRNWILTGNPVFPIGSLFTTARSEAFHSPRGSAKVILGGSYGLPYALLLLLGSGWILAFRSAWQHPIARAAVIGVIPGLALFFLFSPFPEVRFVLPIFLLLFAAAAHSIERTKSGRRIAAVLLVISLSTVFEFYAIALTVQFTAIAAAISAVGLLVVWYAGDHPWRMRAITAALAIVVCIYAYVNWTAYCNAYRATLFDDQSGYDREYPDLNPLWRFVDQNIPADATVAYTNMYLVYPLQCDALQRRLVYAPTRPGVKSIADLGWLGDDLPGEKLVPAAARATVMAPDRNAWLENLRASGAKYLIIGKGGVVGVPPEATFVRDDSRFGQLFDGPGGSIYQFSGPEGRAPGPPGRR